MAQMLTYNPDEYYKERDARLSQSSDITGGGAMSRFQRDRAMTTMAMSRDTGKRAAAMQTLGIDPASRNFRNTQMKIAADAQVGMAEAEAKRQPVAPPAPISFGGGAGAIPDGRGGWTYQTMPIEPDPRASTPIVIPPGAVAIPPNAAPGAAPTFDNRQTQTPAPVTFSPLIIGNQRVEGWAVGPDGKPIDLRRPSRDAMGNAILEMPTMTDLNQDGVPDPQQAAAPAATAGQPSGPREGQTATNPKTGQRVVFRNGTWVPAQ